MCLRLMCAASTFDPWWLTAEEPCNPSRVYISCFALLFCWCKSLSVHVPSFLEPACDSKHHDWQTTCQKSSFELSCPSQSPTPKNATFPFLPTCVPNTQRGWWWRRPYRFAERKLPVACVTCRNSSTTFSQDLGPRSSEPTTVQAAVLWRALKFASIRRSWRLQKLYCTKYCATTFFETVKPGEPTSSKEP